MLSESSQSREASLSRIELATRRTDAIDTWLFPIFDQITERIRMNEFLTEIISIYAIFQLIVVSFWRAEYIDSTLVFTIAFLMFNHDYIEFVIYSVFIVILIVLIVYQFVSYAKTRQVSHLSLYPFSIMTEYVTIVLVHPVGQLLGRLAANIFKFEYSTLDIVFFLIGIIYFALIIWAFILTRSFRQNSAYLDNSYLSAMDQSVIRLLIISSSILNIFANILKLFPDWAMIFAIFIHIIVFGVAFYSVFYYSFFHQVTNIVVSGVILTCITLDLLRFVIIFIPNFDFPKLTILYISIGLLVLYIIISAIVYYYRQKKLKFILENIIPDDFHALQVHRSRRIAMYILHYALEYMSPVFIDFSLCKFIIEHHVHDKAMCSKLIKVLIMFPDKFRELNILVENLFRKRNLALSDRFLAYQVMRIKTLRQSSASMQASVALSNLRVMSRQCEETVISLWNSKEINSKNFYDYFKSVKHVRAIWTESLNKFPNNMDFHEEYSKFLVESATDFSEAIKETHRSMMIESGKSYSVDNCFRSFIIMFPMYLKNRIVDLKGNFVSKKHVSRSNSNTNTQFSSFGSSSTTLDAKHEEDIGRVIFYQAKARLAFQSMTNNRKPNIFPFVMFATIWSILFCFVAFIVIFLIFLDYFDGRYGDTLRSILLNDCRTHLSSTVLLLLLKTVNEMEDPRFHKIFFEDEARIDSMIFYKDMDYRKMLLIHNFKARETYNDFLYKIEEGLGRGENIETMVPSLFEDLIRIVYCKNGDPMLPGAKTDFKSALAYQYFIIKAVGSREGRRDFFNNSRRFCVSFANRFFITRAFQAIRFSLVDAQVTRSIEIQKKIDLLTYALPLLLFVFSYIPILMNAVLLTRELKSFGKMMLQSDNKFKEEAQKKISKKDSCEPIKSSPNGIEVSKDYKIIILVIVFFFLDVGIAAVLVSIILEAEGINVNIKNVAAWSYKSSVRAPNFIDIIISLFMMILMSEPHAIENNFANVHEEHEFIESMISINERFTNDLMFGGGRVPSILGFDHRVDDLFLKETCEPKVITGNIHEYYECAAANQIVTIANNLIKESISDIRDLNSSLDNYLCGHLLHIMAFHVSPILEYVNTRIDILVQRFLNDYSSHITIFFVIGLILVALKVGLCVFFISVLLQTYDGAIMMLRRIQPLGIMANNHLFEYLLKKKTEKIMNDQSVSRNIFKTTSDGIMCLGVTGIVEIVNPSIQVTFGFSPEQLLGQPLTVLCEDESLSNQIELMASGQSGNSYEGHVVCITDSNDKLSCRVILLGINDDHGQIKSFVVIFRNEHELMQQITEAEIAKKKSEDLLYQILPRDIVNRLNQGEKDISFQVASATICFIDVVKFSDYTCALSPEVIMGNLSIMFSGFDDCLAKYKTLTKIKLIGDVYMCAAGLFHHDIEPKIHAEEMVRFSLDVLTSLEETCNKLNAVLHVRIGVNTGGPLIAGVLGTDKPVFDIIGDPINIASRLQSTDVPGSIQISHSTFELIQPLDFNIEFRGDIFLKGKGKSQAYLVHQSYLLSATPSANL